jgi:hypothetical protein
LCPAETGGGWEKQWPGDLPPYVANNILKCEGTKISKGVILVTRFRNTDAKINVRTVGCTNKEKWQKTGYT